MKTQAKNTVSVILCISLGVTSVFFLLQWLLALCPEPIGSRAGLLTLGAKFTLWLTCLSGATGLLIGLLCALGQLSRSRWIRIPCEFYVWVVRGTPLLVQILFIYYALPGLVPFLRLGEFSAAALALALNVGAYNAEVIRAGILAVPKGQSDAAFSLGLTRVMTFRWVVFPQALKIVTPPLVNNLVALLKDSSLASTIGLYELSLAGNRISSETFLPVPVLTAVAVIYLVLTSVMTTMTSLLELKLGLRLQR